MFSFLGSINRRLFNLSFFPFRLWFFIDDHRLVVVPISGERCFFGFLKWLCQKVFTAVIGIVGGFLKVGKNHAVVQHNGVEL